MEPQDSSDLVEIRNLFDKVSSLLSSHPDEALRYFEMAMDHVKALKEEQSVAYQPAIRLRDKCIREFTRLSPMLPDIIKGFMEGRDESWLRRQCSELDARIIQAIFDATGE